MVRSVTVGVQSPSSVFSEEAELLMCVDIVQVMQLF